MGSIELEIQRILQALGCTATDFMAERLGKRLIRWN